MAQRILVIGESGSGKSSSMRTLVPKETFIINVLNKGLPFKGSKSNFIEWNKDNPTGNVYSDSKASNIIACLNYINEKRPEIKTVVIDDLNYVMSLELFDKVKEGGYNKFTEAALNFKNIALAPKQFRNDLTVVFFIHPDITVDINGDKVIKSKTSGKMIENQLNFEGLFEIVLYCKPRKNKDKGLEFGFETKSDGVTPTKTPFEMFDEDFIPNDLNYVINAINKYYN